MKKKIANEKLFSIGSVSALVVLLIAVFTIVIFVIQPKSSVSAAGEYTLIVNKVSTISVYVSGQGVEMQTSTDATDTYIVDANSVVTLRAINESRIFQSWNIVDENGNPTLENGSNNSILTLNVNQNIIVSTTRRNPTVQDYGKYMYDRFLIETEEDLLALQDIIATGNILTESNAESNIDLINQYDKLFSDYDNYKLLLTAKEKAAFIRNNNLYDLVQTGYYLVANNLSLYSQEFSGIGSSSRPFRGVMCGLNNGTISNIFLTISIAETRGANYYGLFGYLDERAVVRNLNVITSIGITKDEYGMILNNTIYAGGLAGEINQALMYNIMVKLNTGINTTDTTIYIGGIAGKLTGGINAHHQVKYSANGENWNIQSNSSSNIYAGILAGYGQNAYIDYFDVDISGLTINISNLRNDIYNPDINIYLGGLFGYLNVDSITKINNIYFKGNNRQILHSNINAGNAYVGGLIGCVDTTYAQVNVGVVQFDNMASEQSSIIAQSLDATSQANLYAGGLFAYVLGENLNAGEQFKDTITTNEIDGKVIYNFRYLFNGNYNIQTIQNGSEDITNTFGKSIAGGLVAKGFFNIDGLDNNNRSEIFISSPTSKFEVRANQTRSANHLSSTNNKINQITDKEHCISGLVFGLVSNNNYQYIFKNINIYANNANILTTREMGSLGIGDLSTGGFIGYSVGSSFSNITLYFNGGLIKTDSLSYEAQNTLTDMNNAYTGGFVGDFRGPNATMNNIQIDGYDIENKTSIGTTVRIEATQNTIPGGKDYTGENYTGGLIGRLYQVSKVENCSYNGSTSNADIILMQGHESPDSAFCGGLIGLIKNNSSIYEGLIQINNCKVTNAQIDGMATTVDIYGNPDIYVAGLVGACYSHDSPVKVSFSNSKVLNSNIRAQSNERIESYTSGILGAATWSGTFDISNCYVYGSQILSDANSSTSGAADKDNAYAAGICSQTTSVNVNISNSVVIDSIVASRAPNGRSIACGIIYEATNSTIYVNNCYSNAYLNIANENYPIINTNDNCTRSYYVLENITSPLSYNGIGLDFSRKKINTSNVSIQSIFTNLNYNDANGEKILPVFKSNHYFSVTRNMSSPVLINYLGTNSERRTNIASIWINATEEGSSSKLVDYTSIEELIDAGWFNLGEIIVYNEDISTSETDNIELVEIKYLDDNNTYHFSGFSSDGKAYLQNSNYPFNLIESGYSQIEEDSQVTIGDKVVTTRITNQIKVYDGIPYMQIHFKTVDTVPIYIVELYDSNGNQNIITTNEANGIGNLTYDYVFDNDGYINYTITYIPNTYLKENMTFYLVCKIGQGNQYDIHGLKFDLIANKIELDDITFANYTPPLNYYLEELDDTLGTMENPYLLRNNSITKFIPIISKSNDLTEQQYIDETNVEYVNYICNAPSYYASIKSNGDLSVNNATNTTYSIQITLKDFAQTSKTIYFKVVNQYGVSHTLIGADIESINYATSSSEYYFKITPQTNYSSIPNSFNILIGNTTYNLNNIFTSNGIRIYQDGDKTQEITTFNENASYYEIYLSEVLITNDIYINISFPIIYTITLDLQCNLFNPNFVEEQKVFKLIEGTTYNSYFNDGIKTDINTWISDATLFGFVFTGFYLVNDANNDNSYGVSFESIISSDIEVTSSITFYARWSFLIELVEAPGTHIVSSFPDTFMKDYYEEDLVNETIKIPINNNRGYVFTLSKDEDFIGEAFIEAFTIELVEGKKQITEIAIEKYYENMYLYFIPPEQITGYLVIATSVSNTDLIIGENTASVTEEILPEDGIYTFKYTVNHRNTITTTSDGTIFDSSYIYNSGNQNNPNSNLSLTKDFLLQFSQQSYENNQTNLISRNLPIGMVIDVYYQKIIKGTVTNRIVGTYQVTTNNINRLLLSEFTSWDLETKIFPKETFSEFLGTNEEVSEIYYFVITPPNGLIENVRNEIINYVIDAGYYDPNNSSGFVEGKRTNNRFANIPIEDELADKVLMETSKQSKIYSVTPSRITTLDKNEDNTFTFTDIKEFNLFDIHLYNAKIEDQVVYVYDDGINNTLIISDYIPFGLHSIRLSIGYNLGNVEIYGSKTGLDDDWQLVDTIYVNSYDSKIYTIDFSNTNYQYFKIDNISLKEMHINEMQIIAKSNAMLYTTKFTENNIVESTTNFIKYTLKRTIEGDIRHNGKKFLLAVQLLESDKIVEDIQDISLSLEINNQKIIISALNLESRGKNVVYFDLSSILVNYDLDSITFEIIVDANCSISAVQLLEATSMYKPAMSEVRDTIV